MSELRAASLSSHEIRLLAKLAGLFSLRMLGLFMILPVFALYARELTGVTPATLGLAIGIYGLTQAIFQIPFGALSDRFGRKPMIIIGLLLFGLGSLVAALSGSIWGVIVGRSLQGAGAIGSVIMAWVADLTRTEVRLQAMAFIGISIGFSFGLAFILGPLFAAILGVPGIFWLTAIFALCGILWLYYSKPLQDEDATFYKDVNKESASISSFFSPTSPILPTASSSGSVSLSENNNNFFPKFFPKGFTYFTDLPVQQSIWILNAGVLILHASLSALFLKIPLVIESFNIEKEVAWQFYMPVFLAAFVLTLPCIYAMDKINHAKRSLLSSAAVLLVSECLLYFQSHSYIGYAVSLCLFFIAFNCLEAQLPSLLSKIADPSKKGKILGLFSTMQFLGLFLGGLLGGLLVPLEGELAVHGFCVILALVWLVWLFRLNHS